MILKSGNRGIRLFAAFLILTVTTGVMGGCGREEDLFAALAEEMQTVL